MIVVFREAMLSFQPLSPTTLNLAISITGRGVSLWLRLWVLQTDQCIGFLLSKSIAFRLSYVVEQADMSLACWFT